MPWCPLGVFPVLFISRISTLPYFQGDQDSSPCLLCSPQPCEMALRVGIESAPEKMGLKNRFWGIGKEAPPSLISVQLCACYCIGFIAFCTLHAATWTVLERHNISSDNE